MTTVAVRGGAMAADTQAVMYGFRTPCSKISRHGSGEHEILIGETGNVPCINTLKKWYFNKGEEPPSYVLFGDEQPDATLILLTITGIKLVRQWGEVEDVNLPFFSIGSGSDIAMVAMHMGATARQAVEIAHRVDPNTGPEVAVVIL